MLHRNGFTLIELMVTMFVALILVGIGIPSFNQAVQNSRLTKSTNLLVTSLHRARGESLKRGRNVVMCADNGNGSCGSSQWENGWLMFVDENKNREKDDGEELIFEQRGFSTTTVRWNHIISSSFGFTARGTPISAANGTFSICDGRDDSGKAVIIRASGRTRYDDHTQANCST